MSKNSTKKISDQIPVLGQIIGLITALVSLAQASLTNLAIVLLLIALGCTIWIMLSKAPPKQSTIITIGGSTKKTYLYNRAWRIFAFITAITITATLVFLLWQSQKAPSSSWKEPRVEFFTVKKNNEQMEPIENWSTVFSGDGIRIKVGAQADCFLLVLLNDSFGKANRLLLEDAYGKERQQLRLSKNETVYLPGRGKAWILDDQEGIEAFYIIASSESVKDSWLNELIEEMMIADPRGVSEIGPVVTADREIEMLISNVVNSFVIKREEMFYSRIVLFHKNPMLQNKNKEN